jgi:hypothetical protein
LPYAVDPDTVWGIAGIITGIDTFTGGLQFVIQNSQGGPWTGVDVFTGAVDYSPLFTPNLARGDSVIVYGRMGEFNGFTQIRSFDAGSSFNPPLPAVRRISIGNPLPPIKRFTVNQLQELPTNIQAEQWEGTLLRVSSDQHKLRVARTSLQGGGLTFSSFIAVDNTICPPSTVGNCDSLFVDGSTFANPAITPPPPGAIVDSVQGIYGQATRGYRIMIRDANDLYDSSPPSLVDAFAIAQDSIRVVFDRNLTTASANNTLNYTLESTGGPPTSASRQFASHNIVHLKITNINSPGDIDSLRAINLVNEQNLQTMTQAAKRGFVNGITSISLIQAPDPAALAGTPCDDRSKFAGVGNQSNGPRITTRGVAIVGFAGTTWIEEAAGGQRSAIAVFSPAIPLVAGREYILAGAIQEFFTETEVVQNIFARDLGAVATPAPAIQTVHVLQDTTCDYPGPQLGTQTHQTTGEDYEGVLVKVQNVKVLDNRTAGQSFFVAGNYPAYGDTILIDNNVTRTYDPVQFDHLDVTGILDLSFGTFRIQPRGNSDIVPASNPLGVDEQNPTTISFSIAPNPARNARVTFALPTRDRVRIGVYDLAGRQRAVLADGEYPAGTHTVTWDGRGTDGELVNSGVYFYKLRVGDKLFSRRGVLLN